MMDKDDVPVFSVNDMKSFVDSFNERLGAEIREIVSDMSDDTVRMTKSVVALVLDEAARHIKNMSVSSESPGATAGAMQALNHVATELQVAAKQFRTGDNDKFRG